MAQLKMYWRRREPQFYPLPEGYTARTFVDCKKDIDTWVSICKNGILSENADEMDYKARMLDHPNFKTDDIILIEKGGMGLATITAIVHADGQGYIHMVASKPECRGLGIGNAMNYLAMKKLYDAGCESAVLTTDEFRVPAVRSYLRAGFFPVEYDEGMPERWEKLLRELNIKNVEMVDINGNTVRMLNKESEE